MEAAQDALASQGEMAAPAMLLIMLLLLQLRAAATRMSGRVTTLRSQPSVAAPVASPALQPASSQEPVPASHAPVLPRAPAPARRPAARTSRPHAPPAPNAAPPRPRRTPLLLRPVTWALRLMFSPVGLAAGGAALYLHRQPEQRRRLQALAQEHLARGEAAIRGLGKGLPLRKDKKRSAEGDGEAGEKTEAPAPAPAAPGAQQAAPAAPHAQPHAHPAHAHAPRLTPHPLKGVADDDDELW